jgi:hypothetical protein
MPIHGAHVQERPGTAVREFLATTLAIGHHLDLRQSSFRANSIGDAQQELPSFILSLRVSSRVSCVIRLTSSLAVTQEPDQLFGCHDPLPHRALNLGRIICHVIYQRQALAFRHDERDVVVVSQPHSRRFVSSIH